jgi:ribosomal protein L29
MFKCLFSQKVINDIRNKESQPIKDKVKEKKKELSPKSMKKAISTENFMKFQWSWTL